ncbi:MAG: hypothetical protein AAF251_00385 [Pseudomonadota bacterium]
MSLMAFQILVLVLFVGCAAPAATENLRDGSLSNRNNLILLAGGLGAYALGWSLGHYSFESGDLYLKIGIAIIILASAFFGVPGGIAKMLIALLPWLSVPVYFTALMIGFFLAAAFAKLKGGNAPAMPAIALSVVGAMALPLIGG